MIALLLCFFAPIILVFILLGIYRYISYIRAKRLFDAYQPRALRKSGIVYDHKEDTLKPDHKMHL